MHSFTPTHTATGIRGSDCSNYRAGYFQVQLVSIRTENYRGKMSPYGNEYQSAKEFQFLKKSVE